MIHHQLEVYLKNFIQLNIKNLCLILFLLNTAIGCTTQYASSPSFFFSNPTARTQAGAGKRRCERRFSVGGSLLLGFAPWGCREWGDGGGRAMQQPASFLVNFDQVLASRHVARAHSHPEPPDGLVQLCLQALLIRGEKRLYEGLVREKVAQSTR